MMVLLLKRACIEKSPPLPDYMLFYEKVVYKNFISFSFPIRRVALQPELIYKGPSTKKYNNLQKPYILKEPNIQNKNKPNTKVQI